MADSATVQECEDYIEKNGIQTILKECIAKICQERPDRPFKWLREHFEKLEKVFGSGLGLCGERSLQLGRLPWQLGPAELLGMVW